MNKWEGESKIYDVIGECHCVIRHNIIYFLWVDYDVIFEHKLFSCEGGREGGRE